MDFAPNVTPRVIWRYKSAGFTHNMMFRVARGVSVTAGASSARNAASNLTAALASLLPVDFEWLDGLYALEDEDTFTPGFGLPTNPSGIVDVDDYSPMARGTATNFLGNGGASKVNVMLFGVFWDLSDPAGKASNGRVNASESTPVANAIAALNAASGIVSIANVTASWKNYANVKPNDHYVELARKLYP